MEAKCCLLGDVFPSRRVWYTRVLVVEKTPIRSTRFGYKQQRVVVADKENTRMQCIIYDSDVELDNILQLFHTYYIGHCKMREVNPNYALVPESSYELVLNKSCYIRAAPEQYRLPLENVYDLTAFERFSDFADNPNNRINVLCAVIHVLQPRSTRNGKRLQEFVVVNEECTPMVLTMWEDFLQTEAPKLTNEVHTTPIVLATRLSVTTFHGISLSTTITGCILFDPPIPEAQQLRVWLDGHKETVERIVSDRLYENDKRATAFPSSSQIRKLSQIMSSTELVKTFWIRAGFRITKMDQQLYVMTCPNCAKICGADYMNEFTCLHCNNDFPKPRPVLRFEAELSDGTGSIDVIIDRSEAESLLGLSADALCAGEQGEDAVDVALVNDMLKSNKSLYHIRGYNYVFRGETFVRYTVMARLPLDSPTVRSIPGQSANNCRPVESVVDQACSSACSKKAKHN